MPREEPPDGASSSSNLSSPAVSASANQNGGVTNGKYADDDPEAGFRTLSEDEEDSENSADYEDDEELGQREPLLLGQKGALVDDVGDGGAVGYRQPPPLAFHRAPVHSGGRANGNVNRVRLKPANGYVAASTWPQDHYPAEEDYFGTPALNEAGKGSTQRYPSEWYKTGVAGIFMLVCTVSTGVSLAMVHEMRPEVDPLPDQV